jgi:signal transduction histidine kinase
MSIISNALNLLSALPGGLVYHLVTLFAIEAAFGMALGQWQRTRQRGPFRMAVAFGGLLLMRLCLMLVALLAWQGFLDPAALVPPLERFFDTAGVVLLCWAFVFPSLDSPALSRLFLIANLSLAAMTSLILTPLWYLDFGAVADLNYNGYWQDIVWDIWKLLLFCMACLILLWRASRERDLLLSVFTCLLVGSFLHQMVVWLAPHFYEVDHIAGWERLANFVAFPLLAVAVYRIVIAEISSRSRELETVDEGAEGEDAEMFAQRLNEAEMEAKRMEQEVEELTKRFHLKEQEALEEKNALEAEIRQKREEARQLAQELEARQEDTQIRADLEAELKQRDEEIQILREELQVQEMEVSRARENLEVELSRREEQIRQAAEELQAKEAELDRIRTRSETELNQATDKIKQLMKTIHRQKGEVGHSEEQRAKDQFIASISQELRTPMTSITGYTDLLLGESVGAIADMQRKFLQRIKANTERMGSMLNDLIGVSTIDAGQLKLQIEPLDMAEVIEDTIIGARAQLEEKEILLDIDVDKNLPLVKADADYAHQIMTNLLSNACKCSPVGGRISIGATAYDRREFDEPTIGGYLLVSITDSGGGIAPEDQSKVFDRFYEAERPLIAGLGETGVGLSIVKALIDAHEGQIWVESEMGVGSTFNYILPIAEGERAH